MPDEVIIHRQMIEIDPKISSDVFPGPYAKTKRARKHIKDLLEEIKNYKSSDPIRFNCKIENLENGDVCWHVEFSQAPIPHEVGAIIGDAIHNLRSALDLMSSDLAKLNNQRSDNVYFPFGKDQEHFENTIKQKNFHKTGNDAVELLRSFSPYNGGNDALRALHDLDIQDKHTDLIPAISVFASPVIDVKRRCIVGDPTQPTELKFQLPGALSSTNNEVIPTLEILADLVDEIIGKFGNLINNRRNLDKL